MSKVIVGYHATNKTNVASILTDNFKRPVKSTENTDKKADKRFYKYWLGNGVYFFEDIEVAKWWKSCPSTTFGEKESFENKAIIRARIATSDKTWDLRKVDTWRKTIKAFDEYMDELGKYITGGNDDQEKDDQELNEEIDEELFQKLRCSFFNWFNQNYDVDIIIAAFNQSEFDYLDKGCYNIGKLMDIYYTEVQYCVYDIKCIKHRELAKEDAQ